MTRMYDGDLTNDMKGRATKTAFLVCVSGHSTEADSGHNKYYNLFIIDGDLWCESGRVDVTRRVDKYPAHKWDSLYRSKTTSSSRRSVPYTDVTDMKAGFIGQVSASDKSAFTDIQDPDVRAIIKKLVAASNFTTGQSYTVAADVVTKIMIDRAQRQLDIISNGLGTTPLTQLNKQLIELYTILPRKMDSVVNELFVTPDDNNKNRQKLGNEQRVLDSMRGSIVSIAKSKNQTQNTMLTQLGIDMKPVTGQQFDAIKLAGKDILVAGWDNNVFDIVSAFEVQNITTQQDMINFVKTRQNQRTILQWHGSRDENWLPILNQGLLIRPAGVRTTGAMYGLGIYFSGLARKSLGYTSLDGTYWARGNKSTGILALFEVHIGNPYTAHYGDRSLSWSKLQNLGGHDSVYAPPGRGTINDERVIFQKQSTIRFLVEVTRKR